MLIKERLWLAVALTLAIVSSAQADDTIVVEKATKLLEEISANPESGVPPRFLSEAKGILIMPHFVETQLGIGMKKGHGVFLRRNEKGVWGNPERAEISAVSLGAEAGRLVTDMVFIYRTQKAVDKFTWDSYACALSVQASGWLSHPRRFGGPGPDSKPRKDVLAYTRKHGILVGAAISGEHKWGSSQLPAKSKTSSTASRTPAGAEPIVTVKVTRPASSVNHPIDSPEVHRLKTVLAAMTTPVPAQIAGTGSKDPTVSRTGGAKAAAATKSKSIGSSPP